MIVFKAFLKVLNKCKLPIILYTVILIFFSGFNIENNNQATNFVASKPDIVIINKDEEEGITKNLISYMEKHSHRITMQEEKVSDALFYRDVNYVIYIPSNFNQDFFQHKNPKIEVESTGDYQASFAEMLIERYLKVAEFYGEIDTTVEEWAQHVDETLSKSIEITVTSQLDTNRLEKAATYYNFANYCILAGCIYVICLILSSFQNENIRKRTIISSMKEQAYNHKLLLSNGLFALALWIFYILLSFILLGDIMFTIHGLYFIINSFLFMLCAVTIAFLIGTIVTNKNAISGIVNVVALGSSFLCGAFVPMQWLPDFVLKVAHLLPSYWYIKTNEQLKEIETFHFETIKPILINMLVLILFAILFIIITNQISSRKRKIG